MGKRAAAAAVFFGAAVLASCGGDTGKPSFPRVANKSDTPAAPAPSLIEPIPPNILGPLAARPLPPEPLHVGGDVLAPIEISRVEPDCAGLHGSEHPAVVELIVTDTGLVKAGRVLRTGTPAAKPAILAAVRQWRYRPVTFNGKPVEVYLTVTTRGCP